ncbi:MAG: hypothetical protein HXX09_11865 [Bacteroidetes bacterium]|nr:hypothetical protein [Bacteroidota bacterium]
MKSIPILIFFSIFSVFQLSAQVQKSDTAKTNQNSLEISKSIGSFPYTDLQKLKMLNSSVVYYGNEYGINGILSDGDNYIIDGMRITDYNLFPISAIETYSFYNSYAPIELGNSLAGFSQSNTKMPSNKINFDITFNSGFTGSKSVELNERRLNFAFSSPFSFLKKIYANPKLLPSVLIAGTLDFTKDPNPSYIGNTYVNDKTYSFLSENPLLLNTSGTGTLINAEFVTNSDFETSSLRKNTDQNSFNPYIKFLFPISEKAKITLGSFINISDGRLDVFENTVFNSAFNPEESKRNLNNYLRFNHSIVNKENLKINYQIQLNYSNNTYELKSATNKDNFFNYGYLGKFTTHKEKSYAFGVDTITGLSGMLQNNNYDNGVDFTPSDINPLLSNYTNQYYNSAPNSTYTQNLSNIQLNGGLLNGNKPQTVYGMQNKTSRFMVFG